MIQYIVALIRNMPQSIHTMPRNTYCTNCDFIVYGILLKMSSVKCFCSAIAAACSTRHHTQRTIFAMSNRFSVIRPCSFVIRNVLSLLMEKPAIISDAILITQNKTHTQTHNDKKKSTKLPTFFRNTSFFT